jgi:hypothetical protein
VSEPGPVVTVVAPPAAGWTVETYAIHNEALRGAEWKFQEERDRRYAEVATEREKALKIKETADLAALGLAREIQTYKDEKANQLREQISSERGLYATHSDLTGAVEKIEATLAPISLYIQSQLGRTESATENRARSQWTFERVLTFLGLGLGALYFILNNRPA